MRWLNLLVALTLSQTTHAASSQKKLLDPQNLMKSGKAFKLPKLYQVDTDEVTQTDGENLLANRVYVVYAESVKRFVFSLTTSSGALTSPLEVLRQDSIVPGKYLGAKFEAQNFRLTQDMKWVPTKEYEQYSLWVLGNPVRSKKISFLEPKL